MSKLAAQASEDVYKCIFCNQRTFAQEKNLCYCCNYNLSLCGFLDCCYCGSKKSVVYDKLNIGYQVDHSLRGLCLNCDSDCIVFECPKCQTAYNLEDFQEEHCTEDKCILYAEQ
jgi:hypothetical protein